MASPVAVFPFEIAITLLLLVIERVHCLLPYRKGLKAVFHVMALLTFVFGVLTVVGLTEIALDYKIQQPLLVLEEFW